METERCNVKAQDSRFHKIVNGASQFIIPVFQRDYSWREEHCDQLWSDVNRVGSRERDDTHFMGSLVYGAASDSAATLTKWLLIDGQQRMTTIALLLVALRDHIASNGWSGAEENSPTAKRIDAYFLKNLQEEGDRQYKLRLRRHDDAALRALLDGQPIPDAPRSRVTENYQHFCELLDGSDPDVVFRGISRLVVVDCKLDAHDDPQLVFESLNSTGLDLSQADLIRNFILMRLPDREQTLLYDTHWRHIEDLFRTDSRLFDSFARDYLAYRTRSARQARGSEVYSEFRDFFRDELERADGVEKALSEMHRHARYYAAFWSLRGLPSDVARSMGRLNRQAEVAAMLVMRLLDCWERAKTLSDQQLRQAIELLESYVFRRAVCGLQTRGYWALFAGLAYRLDEQNPLDSLKAVLASQREGNRFPRDEEFEADLQLRDMYAMRTCHYLLDRLENHDTKEPTNTVAYTIEHVMPQNEKLRPEWRAMLGADWESVQKTWLHRLGNLTLTGYNPEYQDRPFSEKKTIPGGFNDANIRLSKFIREQTKWTAIEIEARGKLLARTALEVWPPLVVSDEALKTNRQHELRKRAAQGSVDRVPMSARARTLLDALRPRLLALHPEVIEVAAGKSIVYHAPDGDYFVELVPRKHRLLLLLGLDPSECEWRDDNVRSVADYKFLANASQDGATFYRLWSEEHIDDAMKLVGQAYALAAQ